MARKTRFSKQSTELTIQWGWKHFYGDLPQPVHDRTFVQGRRWRPDYRFEEAKVIVEIEGISGTGGHAGRHLSPVGFNADCEKYNTYTEMGYAVLRYSTWMVEADLMGVLDQIARVIRRRLAQFQAQGPLAGG